MFSNRELRDAGHPFAAITNNAWPQRDCKCRREHAYFRCKQCVESPYTDYYGRRIDDMCWTCFSDHVYRQYTLADKPVPTVLVRSARVAMDMHTQQQVKTRCGMALDRDWDKDQVWSWAFSVIQDETPLGGRLWAVGLASQAINPRNHQACTEFCLYIPNTPVFRFEIAE